MVQVLEPKQSIFGRIGSGIGQGLAEQLPKEIERGRLAQGLQQFEKDSANLNPQQQLTRLASIPGALEHPQLIESYGKLAREQAARDAIASRAKGRKSEAEAIEETNRRTGPKLQDVTFANLKKDKTEPILNQPSNLPPDEYAKQAGSIQQKNEGRPEAVPRKPWTQERIDQEIANESALNPYATYPELVDIVKQREARDLAQPLGEQAIDAFNEKNRQELTDKFNYYLEKKLQKKGEATFEDLPGEYQVELIKGAERDFKKGEKSQDEIANKWAQIGLELAKAKTQADEFSSLPILDRMRNPKENLRKLSEYGKIYKQAGNSEQYYNMLRNPESFDFTPPTAAWIAYERSPTVKKVIENFGSGKGNIAEKSQRAAINIEDALTPNDSLLAIAREYSIKFPGFDQNAFFKQLSDDRDNLRLNPRQQRELAEGSQTGFTASWPDRFILPFGI